MYEKTTKKQESKKSSTLSNTNSKQSLNKNKETSSCNSCGVCNRLRSPQLSTEGVSSALSLAKAIGKESCAVSFIQSNYGNHFTARILNQLPAVGSQMTIQKKCSCGGSCPRCKGEEEAERVSLSIMKKSKSSAISYQPSADSGEQAQISEIMLNKGSGQRLDENSRSYMEERFGYNFSDVRLHTDSYAARKSNELNAEAFTIGRDVFFNAGRHNPSSIEGKRLLAHELTHVVQQGGIAYKLLQRRCGEPTPPRENHNSIRTEIVSQARRQIGEHYLWGTEGERPGLGDVVMDPIYQGVARSGNCVCAGKHSDDRVRGLPHLEQSVTNIEDYCLTHSLLRQEGRGNCGGGCGTAPGNDIWGECCIGRRHFDCSGFVFWCYNQAGYNIGRRNVGGYQGCDRNINNQAALQPGDLCYIGNHHVGIYAGNNEVVEARAHDYGVVLSSLAGRGWTSYGSLF